jgi:hypothetical protein
MVIRPVQLAHRHEGHRGRVRTPLAPAQHPRRSQVAMISGPLAAQPLPATVISDTTLGGRREDALAADRASERPVLGVITGGKR